MQIIRNSSECPAAPKGSALAIGNFDGVHRGHQAVLKVAMDAANAAGNPSGVMTFEPHPRQFFQPGKPLFRLTPESMKLRLFEALNLDLAIVLDFNAQLSSLPARTFVEEILVEGLGVSHVVTGSDFQFGKGRDGNPDVLRELGEEFGFGVTIVEPQGEAGEIYSSTQVRESLRQGDIRAAAGILGYWWRITGEVIGGDKRGHGLGFPTANIAVPNGLELKHGIYAVRVYVNGARYSGASYLGTRPSFDDGKPVIETFLFDFSDDLYGQAIELEFIDFLRGDEKFDSSEQLVKQMQADCNNASTILGALEKNNPFNSPLLGG